MNCWIFGCKGLDEHKQNEMALRQKFSQVMLNHCNNMLFFWASKKFNVNWTCTSKIWEMYLILMTGVHTREYLALMILLVITLTA